VHTKPLGFSHALMKSGYDREGELDMPIKENFMFSLVNRLLTAIADRGFGL